MSENDFNAAYRPKNDIDGDRDAADDRGLESDVHAHPDVPVEPIGPLEPAGPPAPVNPQDSGSFAAAGTEMPLAPPPTTTEPPMGGESGTGAQAKEETRALAREGLDSAKHVGQTAKREAEEVLEQAKEQASNLFSELGSDIREQAGTQQQKISANLRQISGDLRNMLASSDASGSASMLVDQAANHSGNAADWLEQREPGDLLDEVKGFARRRPAAFLGIALGVGLLAGRITRNAGSGPEQSRKNAVETPGFPETAQPRTASPLPPTVNPTIGEGAVGGTGSNPGVGYNPSAVHGTEQGYTGP